MSFTLLSPPQESAPIFFALPAMNGPLPAELKFRANAALAIPLSTVAENYLKFC